MSKALIVYGTRYGAAASTADEIAKVLGQEGFETRVVNAKDEKIKDISEYSLVVVGSGIQIHRWTGEPEDFLKKFHKQLADKKVALFVCCGSATDKQKPELAPQAKQRYLEEKAAKHNLHPVALGLFGGVYNFNKLPWFAKRAMESEKPKLAAQFKESEPGVYDTRDLAGIQAWARELAKKAK